MESPNDYNPYPTNRFKNISLLNSSPKIHSVIIIAQKCLITIDEELVQKIGIQDGDKVSQMYDGTHTIRLVFKDTKNRTAGSGYQTNPTDDSADSGLDYQHEHV